MRKVRPKGPLHPQRNWSASVLSAMKSLLWHSSLSFYLLSQIWAPLLKVVRSRPWEECRKSAVSLKLEPLLTRRALWLSSWPWPALHHGAAVLWPLSEPLLPRESWGGLSSRDCYLWVCNPPPASRRQDVTTRSLLGRGSKPASLASALLLPVLSSSLSLVRKQRKTTLWGGRFHAPERPKHQRGGQGYFNPMAEPAPSRQQGDTLHHRTGGKRGRGEHIHKRTCTCLLLDHGEVRKPEPLGTGPWPAALTLGSPGQGRSQTSWGCEILRMPACVQAQPKVSTSLSHQWAAPVRCTNHTISLSLGSFWLKHFGKAQTSSWSFELVFSKPSILVWRSPTVQL